MKDQNDLSCLFIFSRVSNVLLSFAFSKISIAVIKLDLSEILDLVLSTVRFNFSNLNYHISYSLSNNSEPIWEFESWES